MHKEDIEILRGIESKMPNAMMTNGLIVANYSSPHSFKFTDGTIVPRCSNERSYECTLDVTEYKVGHRKVRGITLDYIIPVFGLSPLITNELSLLLYAYSVQKLTADLILLPLPVAELFVGTYATKLHESPFAVTRLEDRTSKILFNTRFCDAIPRDNYNILKGYETWGTSS